jgi:hypothetical protein
MAQAIRNVQITPQELKILQEEDVFEKGTEMHRKITKMTIERLENLLEQVQKNGGPVEAKDDDEFYLDEDTGKWYTLKPIYTANVGQNITSTTLASYETTKNAGENMKAREWMYQQLVRFCRVCSCNFPAAYGALVLCRFDWDLAVETFPKGARSDEI